MTARMMYEPHIIRRAKPTKPVVRLSPCSITLVGDQPIVSLVCDCGTEESVYIIELTTDLQAQLHKRLELKLTGGQHD